MYLPRRYIGLKVSEQEHSEIKRKAKSANVTMTEYILRCCFGKEIITVPDLIETRKELYAIGKNLNQLAVLANMGRITVVDLEETKTELDRCHETLDQIRDRVYS